MFGNWLKYNRMEVEGRVGCWGKFANWLKFKDKGEWLKEMKSGLTMTASIIATMSFQLGTNPPGGVIQGSIQDSINGFPNCAGGQHDDDACPGYSVMAVLYPGDYKRFLIANAVSFFASITVCLMLVSGIPLNHRLPTWFLSITMCLAITGLAYSYTLGVAIVTPNSTLDIFYSLVEKGLIVWSCLLGVVTLFLIIRLFIWCITKMKNHLSK